MLGKGLIGLAVLTGVFLLLPGPTPANRFVLESPDGKQLVAVNVPYGWKLRKLEEKGKTLYQFLPHKGLYPFVEASWNEAAAKDAPSEPKIEVRKTGRFHSVRYRWLDRGFSIGFFTDGPDDRFENAAAEIVAAIEFDQDQAASLPDVAVPEQTEELQPFALPRRSYAKIIAVCTMGLLLALGLAHMILNRRELRQKVNQAQEAIDKRMEDAYGDRSTARAMVEEIRRRNQQK